MPGSIYGQFGWGSEQPGLLKMSLLTAGVWARWPLKVPSNPRHFVVL